MGRKTLIFGCLGVQTNKISHIAENLRGIWKPRSMDYFLAERENFPTGLYAWPQSPRNLGVLPDPSAWVHIIPRMASLFSGSVIRWIIPPGPFWRPGPVLLLIKIWSRSSRPFLEKGQNSGPRAACHRRKFFRATSSLYPR